MANTGGSGGAGRKSGWREQANEVMKAVAAKYGCAEEAEAKAVAKAIAKKAEAEATAKYASVLDPKMKARIAKYGSTEEAENVAMRALVKTDKRQEAERALDEKVRASYDIQVAGQEEDRLWRQKKDTSGCSSAPWEPQVSDISSGG